MNQHELLDAKLTMVVDFSGASFSDLLEGVERLREAAEAYGVVLSAKVEGLPSEVTFD